MAKLRGHQLMGAALQGFPNLEILAYATQLPETWEELVHQQVNGLANAFEHNLQVNFWDGMTSVEGYGAIRLLDAVFYKTTHLPGATWDTALQYDYNRLYSLLSRRFSNWRYASSRVYWSPSPGSTQAGASSNGRARPTGWPSSWMPSAGGAWAAPSGNFVYAGLQGFDYEPYVPGMRAVSSPSVVDVEPPYLSVDSPSRAGPTLTLAGTAYDPLAVRSVRWQNDRGGSGVATTTWRVTGGSYTTAWDAHTEWSASVLLQPGVNNITVTVEDIKGLTTSSVVRAVA